MPPEKFFPGEDKRSEIHTRRVLRTEWTSTDDLATVAMLVTYQAYTAQNVLPGKGRYLTEAYMRVKASENQHGWYSQWYTLGVEEVPANGRYSRKRLEQIFEQARAGMDPVMFATTHWAADTV